MTRREAKRVPAGSRILKHELEAGDLLAKNPLFISTFMGISPGGRMNPGREHRAEKSGVFFDAGKLIFTCSEEAFR